MPPAKRGGKSGKPRAPGAGRKPDCKDKNCRWNGWESGWACGLGTGMERHGVPHLPLNTCTDEDCEGGCRGVKLFCKSGAPGTKKPPPKRKRNNSTVSAPPEEKPAGGLFAEQAPSGDGFLGMPHLLSFKEGGAEESVDWSAFSDMDASGVYDPMYNETTKRVKTEAEAFGQWGGGASRWSHQSITPSRAQTCLMLRW